MQVSEVDWLVTTIGGAIGIIMLSTFYKVVRTEWPVNYASLIQDPGVVVNRRFGKYLMFALAPTYIVALLASTTVGREGGHAMLCALSIGVGHTVRTQGVRIFHTLRRRPSERSNPTIVYSALTALALVLVSWLGGIGPGPAQLAVPPLEEFFNAFWTTALVVVLAALIARSMAIRRDLPEIVARSRRELGDRLLNLTRQISVQHNSDPLLVEAILLTENLQRPAWFRRLERLKGRIWRAGTYGPMQVWSARPITDEESILKAVTDHLLGVRVKKDREGHPERDSLRSVLRRYNRNPAFVELAESVYDDLFYQEWER